ncbi:2'-phosphotransferase [Entomortierella parvispora]|uniref:2'-phosphotransferase n=1 Tax=Entomortierella parvispora TaxID=205924 RepID=A0A9P3HKV8_9FUNG|nr:2'-phosphotransferase [Entomortierella parvispora]
MSTASQPGNQTSSQSSPGASGNNSSNRGQGGARGGRGGGRPRGADSPTVRLSKALSWLLRHNAAAQGVAIRPDGYVLIKDVLAHSKFKGYSIPQIMEVVDTNDKKRFQVLSDEQGNPEWIRAVQGHSLQTVTDPGLEPLDASLIPDAVHGTMFSKWPLIGAQGLNKMGRNHIHMAIGLLGTEGVISGMRGSCNLYIHIDTAKAIADGYKFYKAANNVILSDGKNGEGIIPPEYFSKVVRSNGEVILPAP